MIYKIYDTENASPLFAGWEMPGDPGHVPAGGLLPQEPLPQLRDGPALDFPVDPPVDAVLDGPGHLVLLVGDGRVFVEVVERHLGQDGLGGDPLLGVPGGDAGQAVAGFLLVGLGHDLPQVAELVSLSE